jgi:hypothetical protein
VIHVRPTVVKQDTCSFKPERGEERLKIGPRKAVLAIRYEKDGAVDRWLRGLAAHVGSIGAISTCRLARPGRELLSVLIDNKKGFAAF